MLSFCWGDSIFLRKLQTWGASKKPLLNCKNSAACLTYLFPPRRLSFPPLSPWSSQTRPNIFRLFPQNCPLRRSREISGAAAARRKYRFFETAFVIRPSTAFRKALLVSTFQVSSVELACVIRVTLVVEILIVELMTSKLMVSVIQYWILPINFLLLNCLDCPIVV